MGTLCLDQWGWEINHQLQFCILFLTVKHCEGKQTARFAAVLFFYVYLSLYSKHYVAYHPVFPHHFYQMLPPNIWLKNNPQKKKTPQTPAALWQHWSCHTSILATWIQVSRIWAVGRATATESRPGGFAQPPQDLHSSGFQSSNLTVQPFFLFVPKDSQREAEEFRKSRSCVPPLGLVHLLVVCKMFGCVRCF